MRTRELARLASLLACLAPTQTSAAQEAELEARARVRPDTVIGATSLSTEQATQRPGALGEPGRALLDAPGAARSSFLGSELILWGAAPSESQTYVDGVQIPNLFHPAGLRTTVHPALIDHVTLTPGASSADYGRALGGTVEVDTRRLASGLRGRARADGIDSSLSLEGGNKNVRALVAARYGYFDRVLTRLAPSSQGVLATPQHEDGAARLELTADTDTQLSATWLGARDRVNIGTDNGRQDRTNQFHVGSLRLDRRYGDGARLRVTPFVGWSSSREASVFGGVPLSLARAGTSYGLRADFTRTHSYLTLRLGLDVRGTRDRVRRQGTLGLPAREGDVHVFGQVPIDEVDRDDYRVSGLNLAPWSALTFRLRALTIVPSLRLETYLSSVSRKLPSAPGLPPIGRDALSVFPEPRLTVALQTLSWLRLEARTGLYHQAPDPSDLSATFGAPGLSPARAWQSSLGARFELPRDLTLDLVAFDKQLHHLAVRTTETPATAAEQLTSQGHGHARGASLSLRGELTPELFTSFAYTLSQSVRSDPDGRMRLFDFDQTHVLSSLLGLARRGFVLSARIRAATGAPRTQVVGTYLDTKSGQAQPLFGRHNELRLPTYVALDLHGEYGFSLADNLLAFFFDVLNATDRSNVEDYAYSASYSRRRDVRSIPVVAMLGASLRFGHD